MTIGENIRRIRKEKRLTQKQLGELCGINEANIRKYELGKGNPKIETVDRIASALDVKIVDIMERFTMEQYKTTSEHQKLEKMANAIESVVSILTDIYGKVEDKTILGEYGESHYYLIGEGKDQFTLYDGDIDNLYNAAKAMFPFIVNEMKDSRSEKEIIEEQIKILNTLPNELGE